MFGRVLNPSLAAEEQNIIQQNKYVGSIQNKALSYSRLFLKHNSQFILGHTDFSPSKLNDSHQSSVQSSVIFIDK